MQEERHRSPPDLSTPPPPPPTPSLRDLLQDTQALRDILSKQTQLKIPQLCSGKSLSAEIVGDANIIDMCFLRRNTPDSYWESFENYITDLIHNVLVK